MHGFIKIIEEEAYSESCGIQDGNMSKKNLMVIKLMLGQSQ